MKKLISLLLILGSVNLVSCKQDDDAKSVAPAEESSPAPSPVPEKASDPALSKAAEESQLQCLRDVCGPEESYLATRAQGPFGTSIPQDIKTFLETDVKERIEKMSSATTQNLNAKFAFLDRHLLELRPSDISQKEFGMLLLKTLVLRLSSQNPGVVTFHNGVPLIQLEKLDPAVIQENPQLFRQAASFFNVYAASKARSEASNMYRTFDKYKSVIVNTGADPKKLWQDHITLRLKQVSQIQQEFGDGVFFDFSLDLLKDSLTQELDLAQKAEFIALIERILGYQGLLESSVAAAATRLNTNDLGELIRILHWTERSSSFKDSLKAAEKSKKIGDALTKSCNELIVQKIATVPSDLKLKRAQQLLDGVKVAAKSAAQSYLSGEALAAAQAAVDKIEFEIPKRSPDLKKDILASLDTLVSRMERRNKVHRDENAETRRLLLLEYISPQISSPEEAITVPLNTVCAPFSPALFEDHANHNHRVVLSWQTASFHQIGAGIIAHEIGHIVSKSVNLFKSKDDEYWSVRQCSTNTHKALQPDPSSADNLSRFQEEDWADSFAATTLKVLNKTWPYGKNYACALTNIQQNKYAKDSLDAIGGVHSSGLFRALQIHVGLGSELPASCKKALGEKDFSTMSRSCAK